MQYLKDSYSVSANAQPGEWDRIDLLYPIWVIPNDDSCNVMSSFSATFEPLEA
jgi:hypothetical protein